MRVKKTSGSLSVQAIAGTHVVTFGLDMAETGLAGLLGFALERSDDDGATYRWLQALKTFEATGQGIRPGQLVATNEHPVQAFLWSDFTVRPRETYRYRIHALRGNPAALVMDATVSLSIHTEGGEQDGHGVYFNRGVAGSQAYARQFGQKKPTDIEGPAPWRWLSRGLEEALLAFIAQATGPAYTLRAAFYQFDYAPVLKAFGAAAQRGADVKLVVDSRHNKKNAPNAANQVAIDEAGIGALVIPRTQDPGYIAHNKFIILLKDNVPVQVWTGSTNITLDGIFGHSNVGHLVRDPAVAAEYLSYWNVLATDPNLDQLHTWTSQHNVLPAGLPAPATTTVLFSPQARKQALEWYGQRLAASQKAAFYTGAFQTNKLLMNVFSKPTNFLCYILLEKRGKTVELTNRGPEKRIAVGAYNKDNKFLRWLGERSNPFGGGIQYIHTKNLLIDPLSDAPLVITGSANFSDNSTLYNDENMLLIYGDTRVADVYLTEFMRLFYHFYFRNLVSRMQAGSTPTANEYLDDTDGWTAEYYQAGTSKQKERLYFAG